MSKTFLALAACTALTGCAADRPVELSMADEAKLSAELKGYEQSGPSVSCVSRRDLAGNRSAGESAIIFDGRGHTKFINRPAGGCPDLGLGRALVTRTTGSQLCRGDIATVFDPVSGVEFGGCGLGDFTPYKRVG